MAYTDVEKLGFAIPALFFRTGTTVLMMEDLITGIPVP
jgi:hypothetical protein